MTSPSRETAARPPGPASLLPVSADALALIVAALVAIAVASGLLPTVAW